MTIDQTFNIVVPVIIDDTALDATNVPETDEAAWASGPTYAVGARVMVTSAGVHNIYESVQGGNTNRNPTVAANIGVWWVLVSKTNRWRPFDLVLSPICTKSGDIGYRLKMAATATTVALFGVTGGSVQVNVIDTDVSRRNLLTYSEEIDNAAWTKTRTNFNANFGPVDPFGTFQGDTLVEDTTAASTHTLTAADVAFVSGTTYMLSTYVRRGTGTRNALLRLPAAAFPGTPNGIFDLGTFTAGTATDCTSGIVDIGAGWYRIWIRATADASVSTFGGSLEMLSGTSNSYTGDGSSSLRVFGSMLHTGATLLEYQWIRDALTFGVRSFLETQSLTTLTGGVQTTAVFQNIGADVGDFIEVAILATNGKALVAEIVAGVAYNIGAGTFPTKPGVIDSSQKVENDFGNITLVRRAARQTLEVGVAIEGTDIEAIRDFMAYLRAVPIAIYDTQLLTRGGVTTFGFWREFAITAEARDVGMMQLKMESLV